MRNCDDKDVWISGPAGQHSNKDHSAAMSGLDLLNKRRMCMNQAQKLNKSGQQKKNHFGNRNEKACFPITYARGTRPESGPSC